MEENQDLRILERSDDFVVAVSLLKALELGNDAAAERIMNTGILERLSDYCLRIYLRKALESGNGDAADRIMNTGILGRLSNFCLGLYLRQALESGNGAAAERIMNTGILERSSDICLKISLREALESGNGAAADRIQPYIDYRASIGVIEDSIVFSELEFKAFSSVEEASKHNTSLKKKMMYRDNLESKEIKNLALNVVSDVYYNLNKRRKLSI